MHTSSEHLRQKIETLNMGWFLIPLGKFAEHVFSFLVTLCSAHCLIMEREAGEEVKFRALPWIH